MVVGLYMYKQYIMIKYLHSLAAQFTNNNRISKRKCISTEHI